MRSLYDLLGVRADDDEQAIKNAFRTAAKAHHPDLHPDDPDAGLRFRQIVTASVVLRDAKQRAAYDEQLEIERRHIKLRLDRLQRAHRQIWLKRLRTTAAVVTVCCGLIAMLMTAVVKVTTDKPDVEGLQAVKTAAIVETIGNDKVAASSEKRRENISADAIADAKAAAGQPAARAGVPNAESSDDALGAGAVPLTRGAAVVLTDLDPAPSDVMPHDSNFYRGLGIVAYRFGDFPGAIVNLDEAIRLDPNDAQAFNIRGNAWDEIGAFDSALADYDEAIRIDPNNAIFFHERAILWHRKGELDKALLDLDRAIRFSFSDPDIYCDRGLVWYEKGRHERAIADFNQAIKLDAGIAGGCISRGLILHHDSDLAISFADLGKTIHVSPDVFDVSSKLKREN